MCVCIRKHARKKCVYILYYMKKNEREKNIFGQSTYKTCSTYIHFGFFLSDILNSLPSKWKLNYSSVCVRAIPLASSRIEFLLSSDFDDVKPKIVVEKIGTDEKNAQTETLTKRNTHTEELKMHQLYTMSVKMQLDRGIYRASESNATINNFFSYCCLSVCLCVCVCISRQIIWQKKTIRSNEKGEKGA